MVPQPTNMTRSSSTDSSALSNITVAGAAADDTVSEPIPASTPPTSLNDNGSIGSGGHTITGAVDTVLEGEAGLKRPKRARAEKSSYNLKALSDAQLPLKASGSRTVSGLTGRTLVDRGDEEQDEAMFGDKVEKALDVDSDIPCASPKRRAPAETATQRPSVRDRVKKVAGKVGSVLGKRSREVMEAGKRRLGLKEEVEKEDPRTGRVMRELDMGKKGVLDELDLDDERYDALAARPAKKARTSGKEEVTKLGDSIPIDLVKTSSGQRVKKWQKEGLYVGQHAGAEAKQAGTRKKLQKRERPDSSSSDATFTNNASTSKNDFMPLPMFSYLDKTRNFAIPWDIYAPSAKRGDEKPKDWTRINKNRLVGEAKDVWEKSEKLPTSMCVCQPPAIGQQGCEDDCLNRVMQYECNDDNCNLDAASCSNRAFAELTKRTKKGGAFDLGVEVIKTSNRGFGVRACRAFAPGQIIMEYTGEIISEGECQRRMHEEYRDKQSYYLMELERGLIIDGTKGSMARFINHSCAPNCDVRMMKVAGTPRMGVFAGEAGVMTGEELSYDYNFDNFGTNRQPCYCGSPACRGHLSKRLNAVEQKKLAKEDGERKRKAAEEARAHAEAEARRKKIRTDRGSGWRGWVAVDDPEVKERLRQEKREKVEQSKSSDRARRLAARRSVPGASSSVEEQLNKEVEQATRSSPRRRKTVQILQHEELKPVASNDGVGDEHAAEEDVLTKSRKTSTTITKTHTRTTSSGSKFTEELTPVPRPSTSASAISKTTAVSVSTTTSTTTETTRLVTAGGEEDGNGAAGAVSAATGEGGLARKASKKGKEVVRSMGKLLGKGKGKKEEMGKLRQSTLSFSRLS